jgi:hypothetical protein
VELATFGQITGSFSPKSSTFRCFLQRRCEVEPPGGESGNIERKWGTYNKPQVAVHPLSGSHTSTTCPTNFLLYLITLIIFGKNLGVPRYEIFFSPPLIELQIFSSARNLLVVERPSFIPTKIISNCNILGYAVAQSVEALCYKPQGRGFDSLCCHWNFSLT